MAIATRRGIILSSGQPTAARVRPLVGRQQTLGHQAIDSDHMAIGDWWLRTIRCEPVQFAFFLARLKKLMGTHFDHEAALLQEAGGRMCACHSREHRMLLALCDQAGALSQSHWKKAQSLLRIDLARLLREHIIAMDQLVVLFINTHGEIGGSC
jgi:hemerythrin